MNGTVLYEQPAPPANSETPKLAAFERFCVEGWVVPAGDTHQDLRHLYVMSTGLPGETGEVCEHLKKYVRDGNLDVVALEKELGDALHYLTVIALRFGLTLDSVIDANVKKLTDRRARGKTRGSGDDR